MSEPVGRTIVGITGGRDKQGRWIDADIELSDGTVLKIGWFGDKRLSATPSPYPLRSGTTDDQTWTITLSRYHRDNLIQLFNAIGYPWGNASAEPELKGWNTGDWVGEIPMMLARTDGSMSIDAKDNPNKPFRTPAVPNVKDGETDV